jgi:hypothetical protein
VNLRGSLALGGACLLFAAAGGQARPGQATAALVLVLLGVVVFTAGEMWTSAAAWTFGFELTPPGRDSQYQAVFSLAAAVGSVPGAALAAIMVGLGSAGWLAGALLFVLVGAASSAAVRWARGRAPRGDG